MIPDLNLVHYVLGHLLKYTILYSSYLLFEITPKKPVKMIIPLLGTSPFTTPVILKE